MSRLVARDIVTIDFETNPIALRPDYPPAPVGVAIKDGGRKAKYYAWGHPTENNCSYGEARAELGKHYDSGRPLLFHNAGFDVDVAEVHMGMPRIHWSRIHDTMPILFLLNPHAKTLALKPASEEYLDLSPEEQDAVINWLIERQPVPGKRLNAAKKGKNFAGAHLCLAPGKLVGTYAIGDVGRTFGLCVKTHTEIVRRGMLEPYDRERRLLFHLMEMERQGLRVDLERLEEDIRRYDAQREKIEHWIRRLLKAPELNLESGAELAEALLSSGKAAEEDFGLTPTGKLQTNREALKNAIKDPALLAALKYYTQLGKCLSTYMKPWARVASGSGGLVYTKWNSTRSTEGGKSQGARTGRLSSKPNLMAVPKQGRMIPPFQTKGFPKLPKAPKGLGEVLSPPLVRSYIIPYEKTHVLADRDYSQQELRILAHYEDDVFLDGYIKDQWSDAHELVMHLINERSNAGLDRDKAKAVNFGLIYGMGIGKLAISLGSTVDEAKEIKNTHLGTFPNLKAMFSEMRRRARAGEPIRTWGGREYYCEEPVWKDGRMYTFDYKMVNVLIQGSAADCTKEAIIRYMECKPKHHKCYLTVHDEFLTSIPKRELKSGMKILKECMESVVFKIPMLSDGKWSPNNWADLRTYDKKGKIVYAKKT